MLNKVKLMLKKQSLKLGAFFVASSSFVSPSFAAGEKHAEVEGLPQLDFATYTQQIFWMLIVFAFLYIVFARKTLPDISGVIQNRKNHIDSDLDTAEKLTQEADSVHNTYQTSLTSSQEKAQAEIQRVEAEMKAKAEKAAHDFRLRSEAEVQKAEANILKAQKTAMNDMNMIAAEAASAAVAKIIGGQSDVNAARAIIESLNSKAKAA